MQPRLYKENADGYKKQDHLDSYHHYEDKFESYLHVLRDTEKRVEIRCGSHLASNHCMFLRLGNSIF